MTAPSSRTHQEELRAILSVCDVLIGGFGRTTLCQALRGSRAKKILGTGVERAAGYGYFAGTPEEDVLVRIDALIGRGILRLDPNDGYPVILYTAKGLEFAVQFQAEGWLQTLRLRIDAVASGKPLQLPFLMAVLPQRNLNTVLLLVSLVEQEATPTWLPLLRAWRDVETRRLRGLLTPLIERLERKS